MRLGIGIMVLGFVYLCLTIGWGFYTGEMVPGYASLIGVSLLLGGCQLGFLGLIGQYVARVFEEVKRRPPYLVKQSPDRGGCHS